MELQEQRTTRGSQKGGEHEEQQAHAVDTHLVVDAVLIEPGCKLEELHGGRTRGLLVISQKKLQGNHESRQHDGEGRPADLHLSVPAHEQEQEQRARERQEDSNRNEMLVQKFHVLARPYFSSRKPITARIPTTMPTA